MSKEQTNASQETNPEEKNKVQTNESPDLSSIVEMLSKQSEVIAKLADKPEEVNSDGLKHLSEQTQSIVESIGGLSQTLESKSQTESEALKEINSLKLEIAKRDVMSKYGFTEDDLDLFKNISNADELTSFAEKLSTKLKANAPKPRFTSSEKKPEVPEHLAHLLE